ncbi:hypothetical protein [Myxococcus eversor]|uniref:hypothetical protein n=1 Tax=Myxococcus eversor TaxID=2709661 RepID=UPI0013D587B9|nr:hypothetical protein [Myxococcus eversor]
MRLPAAASFASTYETWGTALTAQGWRPSVKLHEEAARQLVAPALVGRVRSSSATFESDGRGAAVWEQFEAGEWNVFLSEFDGALWDAPVRIARNAWRPRVAIDSTRAVIGFQRPGASGRLDYWTVAYEAGVVGVPIRHGDTSRADIPPPEFVLTRGAGGFMVLWGLTELRSSQSTPPDPGGVSRPVHAANPLLLQPLPAGQRALSPAEARRRRQA